MNPVFRSMIVCLILIALWQAIVSIWNLPGYLLPAPVQVLTALYNQHQIITLEAIPTMIETLLGFLLGIFFGCLTGLMVTFFRPLKFWLLPLLIISQAIPTFAIAPLLVIWLGYGIASKIATTILMIFFPVASAFHDGLRCTEAGWLNLAKTMNAREWRVFYYIRLPAALPSLASGIRIAAVAAPIGAIVGEWVGSSQGLGYLMLNANARMQIDVMFAALIVIIVFALVLYFSVDKVLRSLVSWNS